MSGRGSTRIAARLLCAAAVSAFAITPAFAQNPAAQPPLVPDAAELDPSAPLDPMPDLDVAWPDLNARDSTEPAPAADQNAATDEGSSEVRYTLVVEGLTPIGDAGDLLAEFRKQSAL